MELVKFRPVSDLLRMNNRMNGLFDDFFYPAAGRSENRRLWGWNPVVDIFDNDTNIVIQAELPGIDKKDIALDVKDRVLTLKGERAFDNEVKEENFYRRERTYGKFERAFNLPAHVKIEDIKADYKDGVLRIEIPKPEVQQPKQITVH
jgi:HSP20 family protein